MRSNVAILSALLMVFAVMPGAAVAENGITIDPDTNDFTLEAGETYSETITVTVPEGSGVAAADIYLLMDTTGSMGPAIDALATDAETVIDELTDQLSGVDLRFGIGDFKDFQSPTQGDPYVFNHAQSLTDDTSAVLAAINDWSASGGGDLPEGHFYAYDQIAEDRAPSNDGSEAGTIGWRSDAKRLLVTFADVGGHDLVCQEITGQVDGHELDYDITEASATAKLVDAGITFVGLSSPSGPGMDAGSTGSDYDDACGESGASAGQATRMADATGGAFFDEVDSDDLVEILRDQITEAVSTIDNLSLNATGDTAQFVTSIDPADGHGPLDVEGDTTVTFDVEWEGVVEASDEDQVFTGTIDVVADGSVVAQKVETITVPALEVEEDEEEEEDDLVEVEDEAEPATPVEAEPDFTG